MPIADEIRGMIQTLEDTLPDAEKHDKEVAAAATRVRATLIALSKKCGDLRKQIQMEKNMRTASKRGPTVKEGLSSVKRVE